MKSIMNNETVNTGLMEHNIYFYSSLQCTLSDK